MSAMTCRFKSGLGYQKGVLAQMGERLPCKQEVSSSILLYSTIWRFSSAGRASALQAEGRRFDPVNLHHGFPIRTKQFQLEFEKTPVDKEIYVWYYSIASNISRGGAVRQLVGLITQRSQVQILPPQPHGPVV